LFLLVTFLILGQTSAGFIPKPDAANIYFDVSISSSVLVDNGRMDPYGSDPNDHRKVMVSMYFPIPKDACSYTSPVIYFTGDTAKVSNKQFFDHEDQGVFETTMMTACTATSRLVTNADHPLIILEPNVATSRLMYSALAQEWAAGGYAVVTIDHPSDASIVEFSGPNTRNETVKNSIQIDAFAPARDWNSTVQQAHDTRVADISFVINSLAEPNTLQQLLDAGGSGLKLKSSFDINNVAVIGHGFGGTVATTLGATDPRVKLSINMGGTAKLDKDTTSNVIFFGRQGASRNDDTNWPTSWKHLHGLATEYDLQGAGMFDFSDLPLICKVS
ncbi:hypothetical protein BDV96DRAFT_464359, partial [Lophiotrema nucula]